MKKTKYSVFGKPVSGIPELRNPHYGDIVNGIPQPHWTEENEFVDGYGFDKTFNYNGSYKVYVELPVGTKIIRYGNTSGSTASVPGTPYEKLSLPYKIDTMEYHVYTVTKRGVFAYIGIAAPMFDYPGGGVQIRLNQVIEQLLKSDAIKED